MKFITRSMAAACVFMLAGAIVALAIQAGAMPQRQADAWDARTTATMIRSESLVDQWAVSLGVPAPKWAHIADDAVVCGTTAPLSTGAGYCIRDDTVYISMKAIRSWDGAGKLSLLFIAAHEFGHHLQDLGNPGRAAFDVVLSRAGSVAVEEQANCVAGSMIRWTMDNDLLSVTDADVRQLEARMFAGAQDAEHGSAQAMHDAFVLGEQSGNIETCQNIGVPLAGSHRGNR